MEIRDGAENTSKMLSQYVWGLGYIDELISIRWNYFPGEGVVSITNTYYAMQDANYNVLGLVDSDGELVERYEYTPYGHRTVFNHDHVMASDYDEDGDVDIFDLLIQKANYPTASGATHAMGDSDADGDVDIFDFLIYKSENGDVLATNDSLLHYPSMESETAFGSMDLCPVGHQGLFWDKETGQYDNRTRTLHPVLGRFAQRDPKDQNRVAGGYHDGMSLYQYVKSRPIISLDFTGRESDGHVISGYVVRRFSHWKGHMWGDFGGAKRGYHPVDGWHYIVSSPGMWYDENTKKDKVVIDGELKEVIPTTYFVSIGQYYEWQILRKESGVFYHGEWLRKPCCGAKDSDVKACLLSRTKPGTTGMFWTIGNNCRDNLKSALFSCCAEMGDKTHTPE